MLVVYHTPLYFDLIQHYIDNYIMIGEKEKQAIAIKLKQQGNIFFKAKTYQSAIQKYTEAIGYCPNISILYSNRSRCYRELKQYESSYNDAKKAVELDQKNIKAYFLMGETLVQIAFHSKDKSKIQMAIEKLKTCLRLCPSQGRSDFQQRFVDQIYKAKKKLWSMEVEQQADKKKLLRKYLVNIVQTDMSISEQQKDELNENIIGLIQKNFNYQAKVPRALICSLTKAIMKDPICNQYGNSYSQKAYLEQIAKNGKIDPISMKPLKSNLMYINLNLKKAIQHFLDKNPWAYDQVVA